MKATVQNYRRLTINRFRFVVLFILSISVTGLLPFSEILSPRAYAAGGNKGGGSGAQIRGGGSFQRGDLDRIRAHDGSQSPDRERKRDRIHQNNADHAGMLTDGERAERRERIRNAETAEQRNQLREEYRRKAENRIKNLPEEDRLRYRERLENATSLQERINIRAERRRRTMELESQENQ